MRKVAATALTGPGNKVKPSSDGGRTVWRGRLAGDVNG